MKTKTIKYPTALVIPAVNALGVLSASMKPGRASMQVAGILDVMLPKATAIQKQIEAIRKQFVEADENGALKTLKIADQEVYLAKDGQQPAFEQAMAEMLDGEIEVTCETLSDNDLDRIESSYIGEAAISFSSLVPLRSDS